MYEDLLMSLYGLFLLVNKAESDKLWEDSCQRSLVNQNLEFRILKIYGTYTRDNKQNETLTPISELAIESETMYSYEDKWHRTKQTMRRRRKNGQAAHKQL